MFTAALFAGLLLTSPIQDSPRAAGETVTPGAVGVCIRWERNGAHVAEAVVKRSSGDRVRDAALARAIPGMDWPIGVDDYRGQWVGIFMAVGGAETPHEPLPDCSALPDHSWSAAPAEAPPAG